MLPDHYLGLDLEESTELGEHEEFLLLNCM